MGAGQYVDADTEGFWAFSEASEVALANYTTVTDAGPNGLDISADTGVRAPIVGGKTPITLDGDGNVTSTDYARRWDGTAGTRDNTTIGSTRADELWAGPASLRAWVYVSALGSRQWFIGLDNSGTATAQNTVFGFGVEAAGQLRVFWQSGSGTTREAISTGTMTAGAWHHVAAVWTVAGGVRTVQFYIDGVDAGSDSDTNGSGGSSCTLNLARTHFGSNYFAGKVAAAAVNLEEMSAGTLATEAASTESKFSVTGTTWGCWNMTEAPSVLDYSPHGRHLYPSGFTNTGVNYGAAPLKNDEASARAVSVNGASTGFLTPTDAGLVAVFQGSAEWTVDLWFSLQGHAYAGERALFYFADGGSETEAGNVLAHARVDMDSIGELIVEWENGTGVNDIATGVVSVVESATAYARHHLALVKEDNGDGTSDVLVYLDGSLIDTVGPIDDSTGGTSLTAALYLLTSENFLTTSEWAGIVDDMRLSSVARDATWVAGVYEAGTTIGGGGGATITRQSPLIVRGSP